MEKKNFLPQFMKAVTTGINPSPARGVKKTYLQLRYPTCDMTKGGPRSPQLT